MKYHRFLHHEIEKYEEKKEQKTLSERRASKNPNKGILYPVCQGLKSVLTDSPFLLVHPRGCMVS